MSLLAELAGREVLSTRRTPQAQAVRILLRWLIGLVVVLSCLFLLTDALPGDTAGALAGADKTRAEQIRRDLGLDQPVLVRLAQWWLDLMRGDLGVSLVDGSPVLPQVLDRLHATLAVALPSVLLSAWGAVSAALVLAWWGGTRKSRVLAIVVAVLAGLPEVVLVVALVHVLSVSFRLLPAVSLLPSDGSVWSSPQILVLPVLALTLPAMAWGARMLRGSADDLVATHVVASARRRGLPMYQVVHYHMLRRWSGAVAQTMAIQTAGILGGSVVVENMLAYPGLGQLLSGAVASRDTPVVQACGCILVAISLTLLTAAEVVVRRDRVQRRQQLAQ